MHRRIATWLVLSILFACQTAQATQRHGSSHADGPGGAGTDRGSVVPAGQPPLGGAGQAQGRFDEVAVATVRNRQAAGPDDEGTVREREVAMVGGRSSHAAEPADPALGRVREVAISTGRGLLVAVSGTVMELKQTVARSARHETNPYAAADGRAPTVEQLAFRLTQHGPYDALIAVHSEKWGLDPFLLKGLLLNESELNPTIRGRKEYAVVKGKRRVVSGGAVGIAQFSASGIKGVTEIRRARATWGEEVEVFTAEKALDPEKAIPAAAEVLSYYIRLYGRDGGVTAYNTGMVGGQMVRRYGFWRARSLGKLKRAGHVKLQGDRFLLNVLRRTNRLRIEAGLPPVPGPDHGRKGRAGASRSSAPIS